MKFELLPEQYMISESRINLLVPDPEDVKKAYEKSEIAFPYWSQVWPSARALGEFIFDHQQIIENKTVLELAAGLGLPSFCASFFAKQVTCSDQNADAVAIMQQTIDEWKYKNCVARVIDWNHLPSGTSADVLLLSDVNYETAAFTGLEKVIDFFLSGGTTIILATPQRLMAKKFIEKIMFHTIQKEQRFIDLVPVSIFVLKK